MQAAASLSGVSKSFGAGEASVRALRGVRLEVPAGALMMVIGPSGCGKTTLVSVLAAILRPDAGEVEVLGERPFSLSPRALADFRARHLGFVFQAFNLIPGLTALENVELPALLIGMSRMVARERATMVLERVGMGSRLGTYPQQLSGGQQQRVAIARAIVHEPSLVVCDEPTSALDQATGRRAMILLRSLAAERGRTLIVVTHDQRAYGFADRIATMEDGHIVRIVRRRLPVGDSTPGGAGDDDGSADAPVLGDAAQLAQLAPPVVTSPDSDTAPAASTASVASAGTRKEHP